MPWQELRIPTDSTHAEALSELLFDLGALSVSIEDALAGTEDEQPIFGEPGEPVEQLWSHSLVLALLEADAVPADILAQAETALGCRFAETRTVIVQEQDWVRITQAQFDPIDISPRLRITPSWHPPLPGVCNLVLDPGLAFGTGSHPTTGLCLAWLDAELQGGESLLDYGCGSGILAIAARLLGAGEVDGVDIDPQAMLASRQNAEQNGVAARFFLPDAAPERIYDVVVANILTNPLKLLAPLLAARCAPGGRLVLSGILATQAEDIVARYAHWFALSVSGEREGWVRISGLRLVGR